MLQTFIRNFFGFGERNGIMAYFSFRNQLSDQDNEFLTAEFSLDEIKATVFGMEHNKAPGPDGFPA